MNRKRDLIFGAFEHRAQSPLSPQAFGLRLVQYWLLTAVLMGLALGIGVLGYHYFETMDWIDAFLNASMILGGMGPVDALKTEAGKVFAGCYSLFSGLFFLVVAGIMFAPIAHRLLHKFHFEADAGEDS